MKRVLLILKSLLLVEYFLGLQEDYQLENDPRFLRRITASRQSARDGRVVRLKDIDWE